VARGVELSIDDCVRRQAIQQIMCRNELDFGSLDEQFFFDSEPYFSEELKQIKQLENDGLLEIGDSGFRLTPRGRFLARIVAKVFDKASQKLGTKQRFSKVI